MEGLPYDFGIEEDSDSEEESTPKKKKQPSSSLIEAIKSELESGEGDKESKEIRETKEPENRGQESLLEPDQEISIDNAPELGAEAPLEHLSRVEVEAISQTLAIERLAEIKEDDSSEVSSEVLAAESFLEAVEVTGDIDLAYQEIVAELGEAAIDSTTGERLDYESETALPVDPESLIEQARSELSPNVTYNIREDGPSIIPEQTVRSSKEQIKSPPKSRREKLHTGLVDYVVGRRFARISEEAKEEVVEKKLESEISSLSLELASRETHVRAIAQDKSYEKKPKRVKPEKQEVQTMANTEHTKEHRVQERAGIGAHTMRKTELLNLASHIEIEGVSLKQMYKSNLLGEKGLRRVMAEYFRGGNYKKILSREMLEREKDFERDPKLRDQGSRDSVESKTTDLDSLLTKSGINWDEPKPTVVTKDSDKKSLDDLLKTTDNSKKKLRNPARRAADVAMVTAIVALAATIAILVLGR